MQYIIYVSYIYIISYSWLWRPKAPLKLARRHQKSIWRPAEKVRIANPITSKIQIDCLPEYLPSLQRFSLSILPFKRVTYIIWTSFICLSLRRIALYESQRMFLGLLQCAVHTVHVCVHIWMYVCVRLRVCACVCACLRTWSLVSISSCIVRVNTSAFFYKHGLFSAEPQCAHE